MLRSVFFFLFTLLFFSCGDTTAEVAADTTATPDPVVTAPEPAPVSAEPFPGRELCEIFTIEDAAGIIQCSQALTAGPKQSDREKSCTFMCQDPFTMLTINVAWTKDGSDYTPRPYADNKMMEVIDLPGAAGAALVAATNTVKAHKGPYSLITVGGDAQMATKAMKTLLEKLP